jgi:ABC-type nitrate/sulfonate/bicarbonate transport system substrate-binding protein
LIRRPPAGHARLRSVPYQSAPGGRREEVTVGRRLVQHTLAGLVVVAVLLTAACGGGTGSAPPAKPASGGAPAPPTSGPASAQQAAQAPAAASNACKERSYKFAYLTLGWAATEIIQQEKLLENKGWKIEWSTVGPISGLVNAFASGQADVIDMSVIIAGQMYEKGVKLKIFGTAVGVLGSVVVPQGSPAQTLTDLRGKKVGVIPGGTTTQDINASSRAVYGFDVLRDTEAITATAPPELAAMLQKGDVEGILVWEPVTSQLLRTGNYRVLVDQQELWERASGQSDTEVHVIYLTRPDLAEQCPQLLADINTSQREAFDIWQNKKDVARQAIAEVTQLSLEDVDFAMSRTKQVMYGLSDAQIETMLKELKHNRDNGTLLESNIWNDPAKLKAELFYVPAAR